MVAPVVKLWFRIKTYFFMYHTTIGVKINNESKYNIAYHF